MGIEEISYSPTILKENKMKAPDVSKLSQRSTTNNPYYFNDNYIKYEHCKMNSNYNPASQHGASHLVKNKGFSNLDVGSTIPPILPLDKLSDYQDPLLRSSFR